MHIKISPHSQAATPLHPTHPQTASHIAAADVHGLNIDTPGKDTDRFFQAGADVHARVAAQGTEP